MARDKDKQREYHRLWYLKNRERVLKNTQVWQAANQDRIKKARRKWLKNNRHTTRLQRLRFNYGITGEQYDEMLAKQHGLCAVCDMPPDEKVFCVDHNHDTGEVRGLLHRKCNLLVGYLENHKGPIQKLLSYLRRGDVNDTK